MLNKISAAMDKFAALVCGLDSDYDWNSDFGDDELAVSERCRAHSEFETFFFGDLLASAPRGERTVIERRQSAV